MSIENNFNKILMLLLVSFALGGIFSGLANAAVDPNVVLSNYSISSMPVVPGQMVNITLTFTNIVSTPCAQQVSVQLADSYPLSINGPDTQYFNHDLCQNDNSTNDTLVFQVPIDPLATTGTYPISINAVYQKDFLKYSTSNTVYVKVIGQTELTANVISTNPIDVYPGDPASLSVQFSNIGNGPIESTIAFLTSNSAFEVKWPGSTQQVGQIQPYSSSQATFYVEAPKNLPAGIYPLNLSVTYMDEFNESKTQYFSLNFPVKPKAEFVASSSDTLVINQNDLTSLSLTNTGSQAARKVKIAIQPVYPFGTDGTIRYVEDLEPGQTVNFTYLISVDKQATEGQQILTLSINYENPNGRKFSDTADFALTVRSPTLIEQVMGYWYLLVAAVLILIFVVRKRMSSAKKS